MGWGDTAKTALEEAMKAYKAAVILESKVENLITQFGQHDQRVTARLQDFESRLRELERLTSSTAAKVDGAFTEAVKVVILQPAIQQQLGAAVANATPLLGNKKVDDS